MKVPVIDQQRAQLEGLPGYQAVEVRPDMEMAKALGSSRGLEAIGGAMDTARETELAEQEKARKEGEALAEANAVVQMRKAIDRRLYGDKTAAGRIDDAFDGSSTESGYLDTQGEEADKQAAAVRKSLDEDAAGIADTIADPKVRARVQLKLQEELLQAHRNVERHASTQAQVFKKNTIDSLQGTLVDGVRSGRIAPEDYAVQMESFRLHVYSLTNKQTADAIWKTAREDASLAYIQQRLDAGDTKGAREFFDSTKHVLGRHLETAQKTVERAEREAKLRSETDAAEAATTEVLRASQSSYGLVREAPARIEYAERRKKLLDAMKDEKPDKDGKKPSERALQELDQRFHGELQVQLAQRKAAIESGRAEAYRAAAQHKPLDPKVRAFLMEEDPQFLKDYDNDRRLRTGRGAGGPGAGKNDDTAANYFQALLTMKPDADAFQFAAEWAKRTGKPLTEHGLSELALASAKRREAMKKGEDKGEGAARKTFEATLKKSAEALIKGNSKMTPEMVTRIHLYVGRGLRLYDSKMKGKKDGEVLSTEEEDGIIDELGPQSSKKEDTLLGIFPYRPEESFYGYETDIQEQGLDFTESTVNPRVMGANGAPMRPPGMVRLRNKNTGEERELSSADAQKYLADPKQRFEEVK